MNINDIAGPKLMELIQKLQGRYDKIGPDFANTVFQAGGNLRTKAAVNNPNALLNPKLIEGLGKSVYGMGNKLKKVGTTPLLGGAALGGLNLAGLADGEDILLQLLAGAGGAGIGALAGGPTGALFGALGGGAVGDLVPKLGRRMQGNEYENMISMYGENPSDQISSLMGDQDYMNNAWNTLGNKDAMSALSPEEEQILMEVLSRSTTRGPKNR
jgi:hypothetical protein